MVALFCVLVGLGGLVAADLVQVDRPAAASWRRTQCGNPSGNANMPSKWGAAITADKQPLPEYPRPMMVRGSPLQFDKESLRQFRDTGGANWQNLNGLWQWQPTPMGPGDPPFGKDLKHSILVPFPIESCLSGVGIANTSWPIVQKMWYRLTFTAATVPNTDALLLHFGAVDWQTRVWVNGKKVGNNTGGYNGFSINITDVVTAGKNELIVYVYDPSDQGAQPNGKQRITAISKPGSDTYTPSSGIWQTVWLETVPLQYISSLTIDGSLTSLKVIANFNGKVGCSFEVMDSGKSVAKGTGQSGSVVTINVPSPKLWSPKSPFLYDLQVKCGADSVMSYFGMRTFVNTDVMTPGVPGTGPQPGIDRGGGDMPGSPFKLTAADPTLCWGLCNKTKGCKAWSYAVPGCDTFKDPMCWLKSADSGARTPYKCRVSGTEGIPAGNVKRPVLNGNFEFMVGFLDQSFWPDGLYTAPADEGLKFDITATKGFGMNMIRLHQKVNPERWYYHADTVGVAVFQDVPQKYGGATADTVPLLVADMTAMIKGRGNHPCIIQWTTFNEGDCVGVFDATTKTVKEIVDLARSTDWQNRLVDSVSGGKGPQGVGDVNDIHTYPHPADPKPSSTMYAMQGEFGGIGFFMAGHEWVPGKCFAYLPNSSSGAYATTYVTMVGEILLNRKDISASVYTQTTDLELECDGFLNYDRTAKFTDEDIKKIVEGNQKLIDGLSFPVT